jgi:hypothetical protein
LDADHNRNSSLISSVCHPPNAEKTLGNKQQPNFPLNVFFPPLVRIPNKIDYSAYLNVNSQVSAIAGADDPLLFNGNKEQKTNIKTFAMMMYTAHVSLYTSSGKKNIKNNTHTHTHTDNCVCNLNSTFSIFCLC